jgi:hypothetical protein
MPNEFNLVGINDAGNGTPNYLFVTLLCMVTHSVRCYKLVRDLVGSSRKFFLFCMDAEQNSIEFLCMCMLKFS